jgi:uncharacterized protein YgbK (DUF1537 family)
MYLKFAIIADDLTSATDVGIQFTRVGYQVGVLFGIPGDPGSDLNGLEVLSIDCDSRTKSAVEAHSRTRDAARSISGARIVFKSVDSTIRGHLGAELCGVLEQGGRQTAIVAPAFPSAGRTTRAGVQLLNGQPLHETEFANDPINPVNESRIVELLGDAALHPIAVLDRSRAGDPLEMRRAMMSSRCVVADADSDEDLRDLVRAVVDPTAVCWVGSPGLARALGEVFPGSICTRTALDSSQSLIIVVGSLHSVSRRQLSHLLESGLAEAVELDSRRVVEGNCKGAIRDAVRSARSALHQGHPVALFSSPSRLTMSRSAYGINLGETGARLVATSLAGVVYELVREWVAGGLVIVGGDTASVVLRQLDTVGVKLHAELEPGIPIGQLVGPYPLRIITKAGGFGSESTLVHACNVLMKAG